jgi:choline dehydrogenase-like flavoprotein
LETPSTYILNRENAVQARDFFSTLNLKGIRLIWEYRAHITQTVTNLMKDFNVVQCVDLSKEKPAFNLDVTYSRLFGKGQHNIYQFTDDELVEIDHRAEETNSKVVAMSYHGLRMNTDALRFQQYKKTGNFMPVTSFIGVDSARAVLAEDARFPSTKQELTAKQGWKVIDLASDKRAHLSEFLSKIPDKTYSNIDEVMNELRTVL